MINYYLITKPGIILGNLVTLAAGFWLATQGAFDLSLFLATLLGLAFIMASACVFNNYIDRNIDQRMERTKHRALVLGSISNRNALLFASFLEILGNIILYAYTNLLTVFIAGFGFFVYVMLYSLWKARTVYGTAIGSIAGAVPPVAGYCAASGELDAGALIFFFMLVLWQMPHFFSIAIYHLKDYSAAKIPVLPLVKGLWQTKIHMVLYIIAFTATAMLLTVFNYTGNIYLISAACLGFLWLALCLKGFSSSNDQLWAQRMFRLSLVLITALCVIIPLDKTKRAGKPALEYTAFKLRP